MPVSPSTPQPSPPPPAVEFEGHGHYRGTASDGNEAYIVEALFSADKLVRITIFGPNDGNYMRSGGGILGDDFLPTESVQFVGRIDDIASQEAFGTGHVLGQLCGPSESGRYCGAPAPTSLWLELLPGENLDAELVVATAFGDERWSLQLGEWSAWYGSRASSSLGFSGTERFAPFARTESVVVTITAGQLFFQSAASGCTGNGTAEQHGDGGFYVYDVEVVIESCSAEFAHVSGVYSGLATFTQNSYWDYDNWMISFLATQDGAAGPVALTLITEASP